MEITVLAPPDLVVDTPYVRGSFGESTVTLSHGQSFDLYAIVRNQGNDLGYSPTVRYYLSTDATITTSDTVVGTGSPTTGMSLTAPETSGTYYYGACVDSIPLESDTSNNCSGSLQAIVEPPPAPDLVVDTPTVSQSQVRSAGWSFINLSFTVRNQGNRSSGAIWVRYYRSDDAEFDRNDIEIVPGTSSRGDGVSPDGERSFTSDRIYVHNWYTSLYAYLGIPYRSNRYFRPGTYYYIACVEPVLYESDTTNNCSSGVAVTATPLTASRTCIVGYVLTPLDECSHPEESSLIYGERESWRSGIAIVYSSNEIDAMSRTVAGRGPNGRTTTIVTWIHGIHYHVQTILTSAGNERITQLYHTR